VNLGPFEQPPGISQFAKALLGDEEVVEALDLARPGIPRGSRYRQPDMRNPRQELPNEGSLTRAGWAGDYEEPSGARWTRVMCWGVGQRD
jgi:hypothetical protein